MSALGGEADIPDAPSTGPICARGDLFSSQRRVQPTDGQALQRDPRELVQ